MGGSEVYSLREGQGRRRTLDSLILSIPPITHQDDEDTFSARERERERAGARACALARRRRQAKQHFGVPQSEFGGGHSNNDSIHSFTPIHTSFLPTTVPTTRTSHSLFYHCPHLLTPSTFRGKPTDQPTNHAPSLAHNHSTFMEMCVIAVRYHENVERSTNKRTGFGVGSSILHTLLLIHFTTNASVRRRHHLCPTTSTTTLDH